jgi:Spy/CpxP family protein refolding chaperone
MKSFSSLIIAAALLAAVAIPVFAQNRSPTSDSPQQQTAPAAARDYTALVSEVFAPITDQLNLTKEQQFQIVAIITDTEAKADPLIQRVDELDQQLDAAALIDVDDTQLNKLATQEALLLTEMIALKVRARANIYRVLTPVQQAQVAQRFRSQASPTQPEANLGAITIY